MPIGDLEKLKQRKHPEYTEYEEVFTLFYACYKGGYEFIKDVATYLNSHRLEAADDYTKRQARAFYLNYCKRVVDAYTNFIFKEGVTRATDPNLSLFFNNADGMGGSMDDVMKKVACLSSVYGRVDCIVDAPLEEKGKEVTVRDVKEGNNPFPYVILRSPLETIDWSLDPIGNFNWILFKYVFYDDADPNIERDTSNAYRYKIITLTDWAEFNENGETIGNGPNDMQEVFVTRNYHKSDSGMIGTSLIADIAYVNKEIFNWCSLISEQIYKQTFSQLVVPDDGEYFESNYLSQSDTLSETATNRADYPELRTNSFESKIGASYAFTFPAAAGHAPQYISPSRDQIDVIWKMIADLVVEIYRLAGLGSSEGKEDVSGKVKQRQFLTVDSSLRAKAESLEKTENEIIRLFCKRQGMEYKEEYKSVYKKDYDVLSFIEELEAELKMVTAGVSPTLNKYILKRMASAFIEEAPIQIKNEVMREIESGDGSLLVQVSGAYVRVNSETQSTTELTAAPVAEGGESGKNTAIVDEEKPSITARNSQKGEGPLTSKVRRKAGVNDAGNPSAKGTGSKTIE